MLQHFARVVKVYFDGSSAVVSTAPDPSKILQELRNRFNKSIQGTSKLRKVKGGWQYYGRSKTFIPENSGLSLKQQCMLGSLLCAEGNWSSINAYDDQIFTLGMGFSAKGMLPIMLLRWFESDPNARIELEQAGIQFFSSKRGISTDWESLAKTPKKMNELIAICEVPKHNSKFIRAQINCLVREDNAAIVIPDYAKNWDIDMLIAGAHFSHWMRKLNWHIHDSIYKDCQDVSDVICSAYERLGRNNSKAVKCLSNGGCMVPYRYGIDRILTWGDGKRMVDFLEYTCWKGVPIEPRDDDLDVPYFADDLLFQTKNLKEYLWFKS